jgi:hypothetical protein
MPGIGVCMKIAFDPVLIRDGIIGIVPCIAMKRRAYLEYVLRTEKILPYALYKNEAKQ